MKERTCCFTGHRIISDQKSEQIKMQVYKTVEMLIDKGYERFLCGGAIGFDMLAAIAVLALRQKYSHIKLCLCLPCRGQEERWNRIQKLYYKYLIEHADEAEYLNDTYVTGCMQQRNKKMVDESSVCIAYLTKTFGGTKSTVDYAIDTGVDVIYI